MMMMTRQQVVTHCKSVYLSETCCRREHEVQLLPLQLQSSSSSVNHQQQQQSGNRKSDINSSSHDDNKRPYTTPNHKQQQSHQQPQQQQQYAVRNVLYMSMNFCVNIWVNK